MKIGNWFVSEKGIEYVGEDGHSFFIPAGELTETIREEKSDPLMYKWILEATGEEWLEDDELYDLNFAFIYFAGLSNAKFDYTIFDETLNFQYVQLGDDDEED